MPIQNNSSQCFPHCKINYFSKKADLTFITLYYSIICFIIYKIVDWPYYYKIEVEIFCETKNWT